MPSTRSQAEAEAAEREQEVARALGALEAAAAELSAEVAARKAAEARGRFLADLNAAAHSSSSLAAVRRKISAIIDESQSRNPILHGSL